MTILAVVIVLAGFGLLALAIRGRVVQRGVFCRRCRFDLAGLTIDEPGSRCPECGREVHEPAKRRTVLRKRSRLGMTVSVLLILGMGGVLAVGLTGRADLVYAQMPDTPLGWFARSGSETALDELVTRVTATNPKDALKRWNSAIEAGLAVQADKTVAWDPRWGEVLLLACINGQMSAKQLKRYIINGVVYEAHIRDRIHLADQSIAYSTHQEPDRMINLSRRDLPYQWTTMVVQAGIVGEERKPEESFYEFNPNIPMQTSSWSRSSRSSIYIAELTGARFSQDIEVYLEYLIRFVSLKTGEEVFVERVRIEQAVQVVSRGTEIVKTISNPALALQVSEASYVIPIKVYETVPEEFRRIGQVGLQTRLYTENLPLPVATRAYLVVDGREVEIGSVVRTARSGNLILEWSEWWMGSKRYDRARKVVDRIRKMETVDLLLRTDATLAIEHAEIESVLDVTILFEGVPVYVVPFGSEIDRAAVWNNRTYGVQMIDD